MTHFDEILEENRAWIAKKIDDEETIFKELAKNQEPNTFFIGCSDSRVPPSLITGSEPGDLFVHRNIANLVLPSDTNLLACLQYSVNELNVDHIIVCGHYGCGGIRACLKETGHNYVDDWVQEIKRIRRGHADELDRIDDEQERLNRLSELNVEAQVNNVASTQILESAWNNGQSISIHGWIFELKSGKIHDLEVERTN